MERLLFPAPRSATLATLAVLLSTLASAATLEVQVLGAQGQPMPGAVVYLDSPAARAALKPAAGVEIIQTARQFSPRVTVVPVGTPVTFPNQDTVRHHVYSFAPTKFDIKLYAGTPAQPQVFDKPGVAVLGCNIHDQMVAWVLVLETAHHARTGADGIAHLSGIPDGAYTLRAWHESLPPESTPASQPQALPGASRVSIRLGAPAR
jgi:plastocyanin